MLDRGSVILYLILCDFGWVQETRNLKTGLMLTLALEDGCCHTFKGKRFPIKRFAYLFANTCWAKFSQLDSWAVVVFLSVLVTVVNCSGIIECWIYDLHNCTCASATATFWIALTSAISGKLFSVLVEALPSLLLHSWLFKQEGQHPLTGQRTPPISGGT